MSVALPRRAATVSVLPLRVVMAPLGALVPTSRDAAEDLAEPELLLVTCRATTTVTMPSAATTPPMDSIRLRLRRSASARRRAAPDGRRGCGRVDAVLIEEHPCAHRRRAAGPFRAPISRCRRTVLGRTALLAEAAGACHLAQAPPARESEEHKARRQELGLVDGEEVLDGARRRVQPDP